MSRSVSAFVIASVSALSLALPATAQDSGGATTSGGATSAPEQPAPPPPPPQTYMPPPPQPYAPPPPPPELGGWYLGAAGGWSGQNDFRLTDSFGDLGKFKTDGGGLALGSIGYKFFGSPIRTEVEGGYSWHSVREFDFGTVPFSAGGHMNLGHVLVNGIYDIPVSDVWTVSMGAGVGVGFENFETYNPVLSGKFSQTGFMWQAIGGISYKIMPNMEAFVDYRYRDAVISNTQPIIGGGHVTVYGPSENAVIGGLRWYLWSPSY